MYYFLYEIKIKNENSNLNNCYYYGKHITKNLNDNYYGSGKIIKSYQEKYGIIGLEKTILEFYNDEDSLNKAEYLLIKEKKKLLGSRCLNLNEGGQGSFSYVNKTLTEEQKHLNALAGGMANKKRLENPEEAEKWRQTVIQIHKNMSQEDKEKRYSKVSESLKCYYCSEQGEKELLERKAKNKETNKKVSAEWREEFKKLFRGKQPESFRKYGKQKMAHELFKEIRRLDENLQKQKIDEFFKTIEEIV